MTVALTCSESGSGAPVVLLHGLFGSRRNWHHIATKLSGDFHVFALDLRNHGDSPWAAEMRYTAMAQDVAQHLGEKVPGGAIVVGHSMGGKVAMALALAYPELVHKLVVVDISPTKYPDNFTPYIEAAIRLDVCAVKRRDDADALLKDDIPSTAVRAFLLQNLVRQEGCFRWRINFAGIAASLPFLLDFPRELLGKIYSAPTLFVRGAHSDYVRDQDQGIIRQLFPRAEYAVIPNAGHWVHVDQPAQLIAVVRRFLNNSCS